MNYLYKNSFKDVYKADVGMIVKIDDFKSKFNNKLIYMPEKTLNGYCYKDYNNFKNNSNEVCYIAECNFDNDLLLDYVNTKKDKLIQEGGVSTANSIKEEIRNQLEYEEYYYEYERNGIVNIIEAKDFDEELINQIAEYVFESVDWETTQTYICDIDWCEDIQKYYKQKLKEVDLEL